MIRLPLRAPQLGHIMRVFHRYTHLTVSQGRMYYDESGMTSLPGFGLPLRNCTTYYKDRKLFPNALNVSDLYGGPASNMPITLRELRMLRIMNELTDKPDWTAKVLNKEITTKWRKEILASEEDISSKMIDYIFEELKHKAEVLKKSGIVTVFDQGIVKSVSVVPAKFKTALNQAVKRLEDVPESEKDWHPGSDGKVLDLVHPSLFPLVYGLSRILPAGRMSIEEGLRKCGEGVVVPIPIASEAEKVWAWRRSQLMSHAHEYSDKFQWLPCEVDICREKARITSYINNLHPKHQDLYVLIEQLIDYSIPLWDKVLTPLQDIRSVRERISYDTVEYDPKLEDIPADEGPERFDDEDEYDYAGRREDWYKTDCIRVCKQPEPNDFEPPVESSNPVRLREDYREHGLQVIVKLANIHLTPEKQEYEGGSWHVEGQLNEHIVATALYYYSNENIATSKLAFRQQCNGLTVAVDVSYEQDDHQWLQDVYGCDKLEPAIQILGGVKTSEGRLIAFPNVLQHQVQPFKLADPTKPGHRKIVALFLVDPNLKIISTANVPAQRKDWWLETMKANDALPNQVEDEVDVPYGLEKAKELRLELMEERKKFVVEHNDVFEAAEFSLCEH